MEIELELNENSLKEKLEAANKKKKFFKEIANDLYDSEIIYQKEIKIIADKLIENRENKLALNKIGIKSLIVLLVCILLSKIVSLLFLAPALAYIIYNLPKTITFIQTIKKNNISELSASIDFLAEKLKTIGNKEKEVQKLIQQTERLIFEIEQRREKIISKENSLSDTVPENTIEIEEEFKNIKLTRENPQNNMWGILWN